MLHRRILSLSAAALVVGMSATAAWSADRERVIVAFKPGTGAAVRNAVVAARGEHKLDLPGIDAMAVELPAAARAGLSRNPNVAFVEDDVKRYPFAGTTPSTGKPYAKGQLVPWGITAVQADQLAGTNASNRMLCIIDSGYDATHEDLAHGSNVTGEYDSGTGWWYTDESHHGTHVAGTVSALNNVNTGVVGVSENGSLRLHIVKVFGADGWAYSSTLVVAADKCLQAGANVVSMSLGGSFFSKAEDLKFAQLEAANVLSIASAGNDGNTRVSFPAGYASVVSVAAVAQDLSLADFSQRNKDVEIAGPGVNVLSTVPMGTGRDAALSVGGSTFAPNAMEGTPVTSAKAPLADFGLGGTATPGAMSGKICLIQRGTFDFSVKVSNCQASGGVGAVIYNNVPGSFLGTLGTAVTAIPSASVSDNEGAALKSQLGKTATLTITPADYAFLDGTSMAAPHVSALAAIVWARNPACTAGQLRTSLNLSARDLGPAGRDNGFGFGLVQAKAADDRIRSIGCGQ